MYITITFSHDRNEKKNSHTYLVHGDTASEASEAITQLLLEVYAKHGAGVTVTTQQSDATKRMPKDDMLEMRPR